MTGDPEDQFDPAIQRLIDLLRLLEAANDIEEVHEAGHSTEEVMNDDAG
jgi:hypothetical protein